MPVDTKSPRHPDFTLRRGIGVGVAGIVSLLIAAGVSWLASPSITPSDNPARSKTVPPATNRPNSAGSYETFRRVDPRRALTEALRTTDSPPRKQALLAALRDWARREPEAAAAWAQQQTVLDLTEAMTEIFATAEYAPRDAVSLAERLAQTKATIARDCGYALIFGLNRRGEFATSATYAATAPADVRRDLLIAAYHDWGRRQPEEALASAAHVSDPVARQIAFQSTLSGWARMDPEGLADTALGLPDGEEKKTALTKALRAWMIKDPWRAGDWILAHNNSLPTAEAVFRDNN